MEKLHAVLKFLRGLWGSNTGLSPELERYCREEGVDPWSLAEALRVADSREPVPKPSTKKEAPKAGVTARSPLASAVN